jgi:molybdenum cofactor synthesis domain-containing protein
MDLKEAKKIALSLAKRLDWELVELGSALGRVVAESISAGRDIPGNPRSKWDGFALISADGQSAVPEKPVILEIARGETVAGKTPDKASSGRCFRITTGGVLPAGADAVIPFEDAMPSDKGLVLSGPLRPGSGVIAPGSEARQDDLLLEQGDVLTPTRLAIAAATGRRVLRVTRRPRVAILATGDELREVGSRDEAASTFCNNTHLFANLVRVGGGEPVELGVAPDDPAVICSRLEQAEADLVITTGGMGKGSRDFISEVWKMLGLRTYFDRLNLVPGKASALATGNERIFLGFPGNPWAGRIVYEEIAAPLIRHFLGLRTRGDFTLHARTLASMRKKEGSYQAVEGVVEMRSGFCSFTPNQSAAEHRNKISFLRNALAYALLPPQDTYVAKGKRVQVKVPDFALVNWAILDSQGS